MFVEHRGVEPLTSTMRMSRANESSRLQRAMVRFPANSDIKLHHETFDITELFSSVPWNSFASTIK